MDANKRVGKRYGAGYKPAPARGSSTINHEVQLLSGAIKHANEINNWDLPNPCPGARRPPPPGRVRWLTEEQKKRLIDAAAKIDHAPLLRSWIIITMNTGMRYRELTELEWVRVDWVHLLIHLEAEHTKTRTRRTVPMNQIVVDELRWIFQWQLDHEISPDRVFTTTSGRPIKIIGKRSWKKACEIAGLTDLTPRDLRHVCASSIVQRGGNLYHVKELLGHSSIKTTEIYAHLAPNAARSAVDILEDQNSPAENTRKPKIA